MNKSFEKKIENAANAIERFIGLPTSKIYHKEFLVEKCKGC